MDIRDYILKGARKGYRMVARPRFARPECELDRQRANDMMYALLAADEPCMIARFGTGEMGIVNNYVTVHSPRTMAQRCIDYVTGDTGLPWWDKLFFRSMHNNAGIFPTTIDTLERFSERYLADTPLIDLLGSFNYAERFVPLRPDAQMVHLECLYPFFVDRPWTRALRGKRVLVVHPFVHSIASQAARRELLFQHEDVFPPYDIQTMPAVQSCAGCDVPFADWFEALRHMEDEIAKRDFDFCIIGCGAYGLPLAAHVKRLGKKAIHMGGGSQLLFGIMGKRWDNDAYHWPSLPQLYTNYSSLYNEHWVRPSATETPALATRVEGACYW